MQAPDGLSSGGRALWQQITEAHELDAAQSAQLLEACRMKDRCDHLDEVARITDAESVVSYVELVKLANATANTMKQLIAALRLPDAAGVRPQYRGPRGAQAPSVPGGRAGSVSSIERARARKQA
ncbi:MAG TPA: hypothetical protein GXZ60_04795 [Intrasporangiaceae bacterium]|nr:hypothetical protein [Intrasporangiaceae bacterium]